MGIFHFGYIWFLNLSSSTLTGSVPSVLSAGRVITGDRSFAQFADVFTVAPSVEK